MFTCVQRVTIYLITLQLMSVTGAAEQECKVIISRRYYSFRAILQVEYKSQYGTGSGNSHVTQDDGHPGAPSRGTPGLQGQPPPFPPPPDNTGTLDHFLKVDYDPASCC